MENTSIDFTKIRNNSKLTKTSRNEVMQPTASNNHSQPIVPKPVLSQAGFSKPVINGRDFIYLGFSKMVFPLGKSERLKFDYRRIILGSWKSDD